MNTNIKSQVQEFIKTKCFLFIVLSFSTLLKKLSNKTAVFEHHYLQLHYSTFNGSFYLTMLILLISDS